MEQEAYIGQAMPKVTSCGDLYYTAEQYRIATCRLSIWGFS
jgi:hypothetical protein